ncbi:MAG TPA: hypothetical protein DDW29_15200 [Gammaproteobacteria bacterium]|nr:hypothetical protein [Gammaproteobacteria bacterium]
MPTQSMNAICNYCHRPEAPHSSRRLITTNMGRLHVSCAASIQAQQEHRHNRILQMPQPMSASAESSFLPNCINAEETKIIKQFLKPWIQDAKNPKDKEARLELMEKLLQMKPKVSNKTLIITGNLELIGTQHLTALPPNMYINGSLELVGCNDIESTPAYLKVDGHLEINGCTSLKTISKNTEVLREFSILSCPKIAMLFQMKLHGDADIMDCQRLTNLEKGFSVEGNLSISDNPLLTYLPEELQVGGDLSLEDSLSLTGLPQNASIGGDINLAGCRGITSLPQWILDLGAIQGHQNATRLVDISGTGIPHQTLTQLQQIQFAGVQFIIGQGDITQKKFIAVETQIDAEYKDLLPVLITQPQQPLFIKYKNSPGIDQGGLSNQAFESTYRFFLQPQLGLFKKTQNEYNLKPETSQHKQLQKLQTAYQFGLVLGRIHGLSMGVGHDFDSSFYPKLQRAIPLLEQYSVADLKSISTLGNTLKNADIKLILNKLDPKTYTAENLKTLDTEDTLDAFALSALPFLAIAQGLVATGEVSKKNLPQLQLNICGPSHLKEALLSRIEVRPTPGMNDQELSNVNNWITKALEDSTQLEQQSFCTLLTGASYLNNAPSKLIIQPFKIDDELLLVSHSCAQLLNINMNMFNLLHKSNKFAYFKLCLFDPSKSFPTA